MAGANTKIVRLLGEINRKLDRLPPPPAPMLTETTDCSVCGRNVLLGGMSCQSSACPSLIARVG